jgi:hypothetical protein
VLFASVAELEVLEQRHCGEATAVQTLADRAVTVHAAQFLA